MRDSSWCRTTRSQPMRCEMVIVKARLAAIIRISGTQKRGRSAISANVLPGSKKTPVSLENSLIPAGSGSTAGAFSGVISARLYSSPAPPARLSWNKPRAGRVSCESRATMRAKLLLPILAAALLCLAACDFEDLGGFDRYRQDFHYTYPLKSGGRLLVETFNGSVEVSGWDQETVDISGAKYGPTQEAADALKVAIDNSPDSVSIRVTRPWDRYGNMGARFV